MVKDLKTVEEKMYQINRPKMYGWYTYKVSPDYISADFKGKKVYYARKFC